MVAGGHISPRVSETGSLYGLSSSVEFEMGDGRISLCTAKLAGYSHNDRARILLLHGNPANLDDWRVLARLLCEEYEIVAADLPGFGKSSPVLRRTGESRLSASARSIVGLADALGWSQPFFVVGHSHGAAVAQVIATNYPERIAGIVLISSLSSPAHAAYRLLAFPGVGSAVAIVARLLPQRWFVHLFRPLLRGITRPIFWPASSSSEQIEHRLRYFVESPHVLVSMADVACGSPSAELVQCAERLHVPVLFFHGADDHLVPLAHVNALFTAMQNSAGGASFEVILDGGHMIHITHALKLTSRIRAWIRLRQEGPSSA